MKRFFKTLRRITSDENFLHFNHLVENIVAKVLSLALQGVILVVIVDLIIFLIGDVANDPVGYFNTKSVIELFGLFLNVLIALELLENLTGYLKKHVVQVELVVVTALIAVARKIIIFDLSKYDSNDLLGLGVAILSLSAGYWLIKNINSKNES
ncbi:MAG: phosphate-starvation-inducible PsiE family protein [Xenococcaceae cyanobacterium MO_188.B29]|nr:phosphate-starvation-inducible PsiE family protein [Xenococcaceae cyanobacterium MO_188.B29]